jgi:hypothetical protein
VLPLDKAMIESSNAMDDNLSYLLNEPNEERIPSLPSARLCEVDLMKVTEKFYRLRSLTSNASAVSI